MQILNDTFIDLRLVNHKT